MNKVDDGQVNWGCCGDSLGPVLKELLGKAQAVVFSPSLVESPLDHHCHLFC